jgi:hypothetical protein
MKLNVFLGFVGTILSLHTNSQTAALSAPQVLEINVAVVNWTRPLLYINGTNLPADKIAGYRVKYSTNATNLNTSVFVPGPYADKVVITKLAANTRYYFVVNTLSIDGEYSPDSAIASKFIP